MVKQHGDTWFALLLHRIYPDEWRLPKGKRRQGESLEEAALREVEEESGLRPRIADYVCATSYTYQSRREGPVEKTVHYYLMTADAQDELRLEARNFDDAKWLPMDQAALKLTFESERRALQQANAKLAGLG